MAENKQVKTEQRKKLIHRGKRISAFTIAAGLLSPGAGSWLDTLGIANIDAIASAAFGAILVSVGLIATLLLIYAGRGSVSDAAFDNAMAEQIEQLNSKQDKK
jgi:ribosomal protein S12 methylthiotransferase accessory factor YcaO